MVVMPVPKARNCASHANNGQRNEKKLGRAGGHAEGKGNSESQTGKPALLFWVADFTSASKSN